MFNDARVQPNVTVRSVSSGSFKVIPELLLRHSGAEKRWNRLPFLLTQRDRAFKTAWLWFTSSAWITGPIREKNGLIPWHGQLHLDWCFSLWWSLKQPASQALRSLALLICGLNFDPWLCVTVVSCLHHNQLHSHLTIAISSNLAHEFIFQPQLPSNHPTILSNSHLVTKKED